MVGSPCNSFGAPGGSVKTPGRFLLSSCNPIRSDGGHASAEVLLLQMIISFINLYEKHEFSL